MTEAMTLRAREVLAQSWTDDDDGHATGMVPRSVAIRAMLTFATLSRPPVDREAVARIIEPRALWDEVPDGSTDVFVKRQKTALAKADTILVLIGEGK